jgi:hypothetical protein
MTSQVPAVAEAAATLRDTIAAVGTAEKSLSAAQTLAAKEQAAGTTFSQHKAPLARLYKLPSGDYAVRFSGPPARWARLSMNKLSEARKLWGPQIAHPDNRPLVHAAGKWVADLLGPKWSSFYTNPNPAAKYFARGGILQRRGDIRPMIAGEAGAERLTVSPLSKDMPTPTEKRREAHERRLETMMEALVEAAREGREISIDGRVLSEIVSRRQSHARFGERVSAGTAGWKT